MQAKGDGTKISKAEQQRIHTIASKVDDENLTLDILL